MKKIVMLILVFSLAAVLLYAQSEEELESEINLGASPTKKPIAGFTVLIADDAKISTDGKTTQIEDAYVYTGRKFKAVEARLKKIEATQEDLKNKVEYIDKRLSVMEKTVLISKEAVEIIPERPPQGEQTR